MVQDDVLERRPCVSNDSKDDTETNTLRGILLIPALIVGGLGYLLMKGSYQPTPSLSSAGVDGLALIYSHCTHSRADIRSKSSLPGRQHT